MYTALVDYAPDISQPNHDTLPESVMEKAIVLNLEEEEQNA